MYTACFLQIIKFCLLRVNEPCIHLFCFRNHQIQLGVDGGGGLLRRYLMLALLVVLVIVTMILLLTRVGRGVASKDPALDWRHNPNLRTGD